MSGVMAAAAAAMPDLSNVRRVQSEVFLVMFVLRCDDIVVLYRAYLGYNRFPLLVSTVEIQEIAEIALESRPEEPIPPYIQIDLHFYLHGVRTVGCPPCE